jgi:hypothetical protein
MKRLYAARLFLFGCLAVGAGCDGSIGGPSLTGSTSNPTMPDAVTPGIPWTAGGSSTPTPSLPPAAVCQQAPAGRTYRGFGGEALEAGRPDVVAWADVHRPFPGRKADNTNGWMVVREIGSALGNLRESSSDPEATDPGVGAAFGVVPDSWFQESEVGAFAVYVAFTYAYKACTRAFATTNSRLRTGWFEHTAFPPDRPRAEAFCERTQRAAWMREPSEDEREACVELALTLDEPDVTSRWAMVCASVFASVNFLAD